MKAIGQKRSAPRKSRTFRLSSRNSTPIAIARTPSTTCIDARLVVSSFFIAGLPVRRKTPLDKWFEDQADAPCDDQEGPAVVEAQAVHSFEDGEQPAADEDVPQAA